MGADGVASVVSFGRVSVSVPIAAAGPRKPPGPDGDDGGGGGNDGDFDENADVDIDVKSATPKRYKVIYHNDDYTTMEFVVETLMRFFHKTQAEATHIMLTVHTKGNAVAGVYTRDVAETKVENVMNHARESGMPLLVTSEPE
jgi:ATP-dependent Clp protease adaptor protein ClpS